MRDCDILSHIRKNHWQWMMDPCKKKTYKQKVGNGLENIITEVCSSKRREMLTRDNGMLRIFFKHCHDNMLSTYIHVHACMHNFHAGLTFLGLCIQYMDYKEVANGCIRKGM